MINIISQHCDIGQKKEGTQYASEIIIENLNLKNPVFEIDNYIKDEKSKFHSSGYLLSYNTVLNLEKQNKSWISLGGDHSVSSSTISAIIDCNQEQPLIIWIDAHADINNEKTSPSGNSHGMPVAYLMGLCEEKPDNFLLPQNLIYIGIRDLDEGEKNFVQDYQIKFFTNAAEVKNLSSSNTDLILDQIVEQVSKRNNKRIHFSIDIDALDPNIAPSTGTSVKNGLDLFFVCDLISECSKIKKIQSADIVEINPHIGTNEEVEKTINTTVKIFNTLMNCIIHYNY